MDITLALAGALPAIAAMAYVDKVDAKRPEPRSALRRVAIAGGVATVPCIIVQLILDAFYPTQGVGNALATAYLSAGVVEESAKAACLFLFVWRRPEFDERFDGIVYATRAGLGFALVENVGYLLGTDSLAGWMGVFIARAVLAVPGHAIFAGMMGYFAAQRRFDGKGPGLMGGLLLAVLLHGTYDAGLMLMPYVPEDQAALYLPLLAAPVAIILGGFVALRAMSRRAIAADDAARARAEAAVPAAPPASLAVAAGFALR